MQKKFENWTADRATAALIGFVIRSKQYVSGYEAVRQSTNKNKIDLILLNNDVSENTIKKVSNTTKHKNIYMVKTSQNTNWKQLWGFNHHKILGIIKGNLSSKIIENIKAGV